MPKRKERPGPCHRCKKKSDDNYWMRKEPRVSGSPMVSWCGDCSTSDDNGGVEIETRKSSALSEF